MFKKPATSSGLVLFTAGMITISSAGSQSAQSEQPQVQQRSGSNAKTASAGQPYRNQPVHLSNRASMFYQSLWGIDALRVKAVESGLMIQFSYIVIDAERAKVLSDKKSTPFLQSPAKGLQLVVPTMEKVGQLRQAPHELKPGESYWMAFSNPGRQIMPGDHVDVVIGSFHARGLVVE